MVTWDKFAILSYYKNFSVLASNTVNIKRYNPQNQKLFGALNNTYKFQEFLQP